jgi:hypothetical protein
MSRDTKIKFETGVGTCRVMIAYSDKLKNWISHIKPGHQPIRLWKHQPYINNSPKSQQQPSWQMSFQDYQCQYEVTCQDWDWVRQELQRGGTDIDRCDIDARLRASAVEG